MSENPVRKALEQLVIDMKAISKMLGEHQLSSVCLNYATRAAAALDAGESGPKAQLAEAKGPRIVCLCGSTRFYEYFQRANYEETMAGRIVLSVGFYPHAQKEMHHSEDVGCTPEQKIILDELHKRKIDLADEVFVLNVGGYIGSSTRSEIEYAISHNKPLRYLEPSAALSAPAKEGESPKHRTIPPDGVPCGLIGMESSLLWLPEELRKQGK